MVRGPIAMLVLLSFAGCGAHHPARHQAQAHPFPADPQVWARASTPAQRHSLGVLAADVTRLRSAAADTTERTLMGTPALRRGTNRFLVDLDHSPVDLLSKNRIIDHAAAAASAGCDQCFQELEADRPIPQIAGH